MSNGLKTFFTDLANVYREASGTTDKVVANTLPTLFDELLKNGVGGGDSELIAYVTFMSEDGSTELFKMPVLKGDNCKDPVEHGDIEAPTKESTAQNNYSFSGWGNVNDVAIPTILNNITEDRVVYASFSASTRYYTINYYDGETLVHTEQLTYGSSSDYFYEKAGYTFESWTPAPTNITGDLNCYGKWYENTEIMDDWDVIKSYCDDGTYSTRYKVGMKKDLIITYSDGTTETIPMIVREMNPTNDRLTSSIYTKAKLVFIADKELKDTYKGSTIEDFTWANSPCYTYLNETILPCLPQTLQNAVTDVTEWDGKTSTSKVKKGKLWVPAINELCSPSSQNWSDVSYARTYYNKGIGKYSGFDGVDPLFDNTTSEREGWQIWTRAMMQSQGYTYATPCGVTNTVNSKLSSNSKYWNGTINSSTNGLVVIGFCL